MVAKDRHHSQLVEYALTLVLIGFEVIVVFTSSGFHVNDMVSNFSNALGGYERDKPRGSTAPCALLDDDTFET